MLRFLALLGILTASLHCAAANQVQGVRLWAAPDNTRVVFDVSGPVKHKLLTLRDPDRVVIDLSATTLGEGVRRQMKPSGLVRDLRSGPRGDNDLRLVLDLEYAVKPKSFVLKPNKRYGHRLVIDLFPKSGTAGSKSRPVKAVDDEGPLRDLVIAIDAGHGGEDPGALGRHGTREKDVVMQISRRLARIIDKEPGMRAVLVRDGDYYIGLRKRMEKARLHRADLFISIHADAFRDRRVQGSSVFVLSRRGASSEMARWLAARENAADLVGGVSLDDKDDLLAEVLLDLAQSATLEASTEVADRVLREMKRVGKVHKRQVQHAGFMVLKSPDIPSILIETAFISNPNEEKRLRVARHQDKVAGAILAGVRSYFINNPPPGTWLAKHRPRTHVVRSGETLSGIAQRYGVSLNSLRSSNQIRGDRLLVGNELTIPSSGG